MQCIPGQVGGLWAPGSGGACLGAQCWPGGDGGGIPELTSCALRLCWSPMGRNGW